MTFSFLNRLNTILATLLLLCTLNVHAQVLRLGITPEAQDPSPVYDKRFENAESKVLKTRVIYEVRKDTPSKAAVWRAFTKRLEQKTGLQFQLLQPSSQLEFERALAQGLYDIAYTSPLQFLSAYESQNYRALAKRKAQPLRALIIVKKFDKGRTLRDIETAVTGFSSLLNYSSSIIPRYSMKRLGISLPMQLFPDNESMYSALINDEIRAMSIAEADFYSLPPDQQDKLKILWETPGFAAFAFSAHPRVPFYSINKLQRAMVNLNRRDNNKELLQLLGARNGYEVARNNDWIDAQSIDIDALNMHLPLVTPLAQE